MNLVEIKHGNSPIVLGIPHTGNYIPDEVFAKLTPLGKTLADTDWHIERLYDGLLPAATTVRAIFHRYVIDPNRDPSGESLYPGQNTTSLVPLTDFGGQPLWTAVPNADEIQDRRIKFHGAYHKALAAELERIRSIHGYAILYDCHSIRSKIPFLFGGTLPDFNIGTNNGTTCDHKIEQAVADICRKADGYSTVVNGRFKGGWTTRNYGRPQDDPKNRLHAIQMEIAQSAYLKDESLPFDYDERKAERLRFHLAKILKAIAAIKPSHSSI